MSGRAGRVCLGVIAGPHGIRGEVRIKAFTEDPKAIADYGPLTDEAGGRSFKLRLTGTTRGQMIARIEGIDDRTGAEALKGLRLHVARAALPAPAAEEYYHADLIGLAVEGEDGGALGRVAAVQNFGAGDLLEIERPDGTSLVLPFTRAAVPVVDIEGGRLVAAPPAGLLAAEEPRPAPGPGRRKGA